MTDLGSNDLYGGEHLNDDILDEYALDRLPEGKLHDSIVEHLLVCPQCQEKLEAIDALREALRQNLRKNRRQSAGSSSV